MCFGPPICRGIPQISDMYFQIELTSDHVAEYGLHIVPFSELREQLTKKRRKKEEYLVKYKSADILCWAA